MQHTSQAFENELRELTEKLSVMGKSAKDLLDASVVALLAGDTPTASRLVEDDQMLDAFQREIETLAVSMIARRQPVADDLRRIVAAMRMAGDLERIGDLAKNIAKRTKAIDAPLGHGNIAVGVEGLTDAVSRQLATVLDAFRDNDAAAAEFVRIHDVRVDRLYTSLFRELLTYMMEDPRNITHCAHLLFCAKNLERVGDHATNLAETIEFALSGVMPDIDRPRGPTVLGAET